MALARSYLDELDALLLGQSEDCMLISQLDGFLTGILVSPQLVPPSRWLSCVWRGDDGEGVPDFATMDQFQHFLDLIMQHYNAILSALDRPGRYDPILETDTRNGDILWEMWVDGFSQAMDLAPEGWLRILSSGDAGCQAALTGLKTLNDFASGNIELSRVEEDAWDQQAPSLIPIWVNCMRGAWNTTLIALNPFATASQAEMKSAHAVRARNTGNAAA